MLFMVYPHMIPIKTPAPLPPSSSLAPPLSARDGPSGVGSVSTAAAAAKAERYRPKIFGFQVNEIARLQRWQEASRDRCALASFFTVRLATTS